MNTFKTKVLKSFFSFLLISMFVLPMFFVGNPAQADITGADLWGGEDLQDEFADYSQLGDEDPRTIAASVISVLLGFLGIIAVVIILYAGFLWMTAAGNEDRVATAKKVMSAGVIGLIIVLAAYGLANFMIEAIVGATTGG